MADSAQEELLLAPEIAEAPGVVRFYLAHERAVLGIIAVIVFLTYWEGLTRGWWADFLLTVGIKAERMRINPIFLSSPTAIARTGVRLFASGEIWKDLRVSAIEFVAGFLLSLIHI